LPFSFLFFILKELVALMTVADEAAAAGFKVMRGGDDNTSVEAFSEVTILRTD
jgi:hypothetical protein